MPFKITHEERIFQDATTIALIGLGVGAVSTGVQIQQQREAEKAQRKSQQAQQRIADIRAQRERIQQVRRARLAQAQVQAQGFAAGAPGSSAVAGGVSGVQAQLGSNLGFISQQQQLAGQASIFNQQALTAQGRAATAGAFTGLAFQGASIFIGARSPDQDVGATSGTQGITG